MGTREQRVTGLLCLLHRPVSPDMGPQPLVTAFHIAGGDAYGLTAIAQLHFGPPASIEVAFHAHPVSRIQPGHLLLHATSPVRHQAANPGPSISTEIGRAFHFEFIPIFLGTGIIFEEDVPPAVARQVHASVENGYGMVDGEPFDRFPQVCMTKARL